MRCPVCGGSDFSEQEVLWAELVNDWQLGPEEESYINRQQGFACTACGNNLRSMALSKAVLTFFGVPDVTLRDWVHSEAARSTAILEINEAGGLTQTLSQMPRHQLVTYPEVDIHALPFGDGAFDLVVHSDTLEHVANPTHALAECQRVLRPGGACIFTIPVIVGRLGRSRKGLKPSYHGDRSTNSEGLKVETEFGADFWAMALEAGYGSLQIHALEYPAGLAIAAVKGPLI